MGKGGEGWQRRALSRRWRERETVERGSTRVLVQVEIWNNLRTMTGLDGAERLEEGSVHLEEEQNSVGQWC